MPFPGACGEARQPGPGEWVAAGPEVVRAEVPAPAKRPALAAAGPAAPGPAGPAPGAAGARRRGGRRGGELSRRAADLGGHARGSVPELILEIVGVLAVPFPPEYGRSAQHGVPDLVETAGLVALLSNPEGLPVVEISGQIELEAVASRHGAMEATAAVELEGERFHEAHREYVVDGRGLARLPITRGCRFLRSPRREPPP